MSVAVRKGIEGEIWIVMMLPYCRPWEYSTTKAVYRSQIKRCWSRRTAELVIDR